MTSFKTLLAGACLTLALGAFIPVASAVDLGVGANTGINIGTESRNSGGGVELGAGTRANGSVTSSDAVSSSNRADIHADAQAKARRDRNNARYEGDTYGRDEGRIHADTRARVDTSVNDDVNARVNNDTSARINAISTRNEEIRREDNRRRSWWQGDSSVRARGGLND